MSIFLKARGPMIGKVKSFFPARVYKYIKFIKYLDIYLSDGNDEKCKFK